MEITLEKSARVKKEERAGFQSLFLEIDPTPPIYEVKRAHFICFLVSVLLYGCSMWYY